MPEKTPGFPVGSVLVLFVVVGVLLIALLSGQPHIPPATRIPPTVVAVVPTATATQAPAQAAQTESAVAAVPTTAGTQAPVLDVGVDYTDDQVRQGQMLFGGTCAACHGPDAHGIPGLGKNLAASTFVHGLSNDELLAFIIKGRPVTDPLNTTGVAMPPRGANPSLTDDQLHLIIDFIRSQQVKNGTSGAAAPTATPGNAQATKPFVLPIQSLGLETATPTKAFQLPINSLNLGTATPDEAVSTTATLPPTAVPTTAATAVPTTAPTQVTSPTATSAGGFQLPINSLNLPTATFAP